MSSTTSKISSRRALKVGAGCTAAAAGFGFALTSALPVQAAPGESNGTMVWVCVYKDGSVQPGNNPNRVSWEKLSGDFGNIEVGNAFESGNIRNLIIQINGDTSPGLGACPGATATRDDTPGDQGGDNTTPGDQGGGQGGDQGGDNTTPGDQGGDNTTPGDQGGDNTTPGDQGGDQGGDNTTPGDQGGDHGTKQPGTKQPGTKHPGTKHPGKTGHPEVVASDNSVTPPSAVGGLGTGAPHTGGAGENHAPVNGLIGGGLLFASLGLFSRNVLRGRETAPDAAN